MQDKHPGSTRHSNDYEWNRIERQEGHRSFTSKGREWLIWAVVFVGLFFGFHIVIEEILPAFLRLE